AQPADLYVNDAFAVCHREQASVGAIKKFLPAYAGLLLTQEVESLNKVLKPKKPLVSIIGGSKISTKAPLVKKLYAQSNHLLIGGALANNFFLACGYEVGKSLIDKDSIAFAKKYFSKSKRDKKIILPIDVVVRNDKKKVTVKKLTAIAKNDMILDIGPESISLFAIYIKKAQTLAWNGPMGKFEEDSFKHGTLAVARLIATRSTGHAFGVVGGGETVEVLKMSKMFEYVDWVSTGGGAMLSYLGGEKMPGLKGIVN
nr:phosphoglycerate kinase [Planctomycetota bacterium]